MRNFASIRRGLFAVLGLALTFSIVPARAFAFLSRTRSHDAADDRFLRGITNSMGTSRSSR